LAVRAAVEAHIGKTTCQVIELNVQLQMATSEIARLTAELNVMAERLRLAEEHVALKSSPSTK
jgi:uncharacterized small protein (DUF1192 family)